MTGFSLERLKQKVSHRFSEPSIFDVSSSPAERRKSTSSESAYLFELTPPPRMRSLSFSSDLRSRSKSVSKKQAKELIRQETSQIILKKLLSTLDDLGLQSPIPVDTPAPSVHSSPRQIRLFVSNSNDCIYLAPTCSMSMSYEDLENGGLAIPEPLDVDSPLSPPIQDFSLSEFIPTTALQKAMKSFSSPNYLCSKIDSDTLIPHLFAVIVELVTPCSLLEVSVNLLSNVSTLWPAHEKNVRFLYKEKFKIGSLDWVLSLDEADYFFSTKNSNETKSSNITPDILSERTKNYRLFDLKESSVSPSQMPLQSSNPVKVHLAGLYVFLLPVLFPHHIPATIYSVNGSLNHKLSIQIPLHGEKLQKTVNPSGYFNLPMVRTPPSLANSIADKPIYINRVWGDALNYSITFPRKYIALGIDHPISIKLIPLVKDVIVKRIRFNVLERITYMSRDLSKEYDYDGEEPFLMKKRSLKIKERVVPLCELKTKNKNSTNMQIEPFKEEIVTCPGNNLLFSAYNYQTNSLGPRLLYENDDNVISSPLEINLSLPFLTSRGDKDFQSFSVLERNRSPNSCGSASPSRKTSITKIDMNSGSYASGCSSLGEYLQKIDGSFEMDEPDSACHPIENLNTKRDFLSRGYTVQSRALAPDSNFRHIQVSHRLQICFRISKPDPADNNRMHHYEVVVDTPLALLSAKCGDSSIQLPRYDEIERNGPEAVLVPPTREIKFRTPVFDSSGVSIKPLDEFSGEQLPSFEEATFSTDPVSKSPREVNDIIVRMNSITPSEPAPSYDHFSEVSSVDDSLEQFRIDDVFSEPSPLMSPRRKSTIRESLLNSFAPALSLSLNSSISRIIHSESSNDLLTDISSEVSDESKDIFPEPSSQKSFLYLDELELTAS